MQTYKEQMPDAFRFNQATGYLRRDRGAHRPLDGRLEHFAPWRTIDGEEHATDGDPSSRC